MKFCLEFWSIFGFDIPDHYGIMIGEVRSEIRAKKRSGEENFVSCMRKAVREKYGNLPVGLGGVFMIEKGKAKLHVMVSFSNQFKHYC